MRKIFPRMRNRILRVFIKQVLPNRVPEVQESKMAVKAEPLGRLSTNHLWSFWKEGQQGCAITVKQRTNIVPDLVPVECNEG